MGLQLPPVGTFPPSSPVTSGKKALSVGPAQPVPDKDPEEKLAELTELKQMK